MGVPQHQLTYIFPAPLFAKGVGGLKLKDKRRPLQLSTWQPHLCSFRTVASISNRAIYCVSNDDDDNRDIVENANAAPRTSWDPFKPWFSPKTAQSKGKTAEPQQSNPADGPEEPHDLEPSSSSVSNKSASTQNGNKSSDDRFRWPWESKSENQASTQNTHHQNKQLSQSAKSNNPGSESKTRKPVKHSDSKPGASIGIEQSPVPPKDGLTWQDRWKRVLEVIIPNNQRKQQNSKDENSKSSPVASQKYTESAEEKDGESSISSSSKRQGGIFELYKPPAQKLKNREDMQKKKSGWFKHPWVRDSDSDPDSSSGEDSTDSANTTSSFPVSGNSDSEDRTRDKSTDVLIDSDQKEGTTGKPNNRDPWSTPWDRRGGNQKNTTRSEKSSDNIRKKGKITFPTKRPWFRWPGMRSKSNSGETAETIEEQSEASPQTTSTAVEESSESGENGKEAEREKANEKLSTNNTNGKRNSEKPELERKRKLVSSRRGPRSSPGYSDSYLIPQQDISKIRQIFGSETFFATDTIPAPGGLLFHGNLRAEPQAAVDKLEERLESRFGEKYTLCLAEGEDQGPVVVVVPTSYHEQSVAPRHRLMAVGLAMLTISTCLSRGLVANVWRPRIIDAHGTPPCTSLLEKLFYTPLASTVTVACAIALFILLSQIVQRVVASFYRTKFAVPFVLPSYQLGSFGSVSYLVSPAPSRAALFDIAVSSTVALVIPAITCLVIGLRMSTSFASVFPVPMSTVSGSLLMGFLTKQVPNGQILVDYQRSLIGLHPLAVIGANCLTIAGLNLLPIRQLDGNRIIASLFGRRAASRAWRLSVLYLLFASSKNPYLIMFLLIVSFGPWQVDRPSRNELTEPDNVRTVVGYLFMLLMIALLLPYPKSSFFGTL